MTPSAGIILLEGADASGKTTLARHLVENHGARYIHGGLYRDPWRWHVAAIRRATRLATTGHLVVIDRNWLSHLTYGEVFNNQQYDVGTRCLDRVLRRYGTLIILCAPADQERQAERWAAGRAAGKREHFNRIREVVALYADLRDGNLARPGDGYLGQLIRFGDFTQRDDVLVYDIDRDGGNLTGFARRAIQRIAQLQRHVVPYRGDNLSGRTDHLRPQTLIVGDLVDHSLLAKTPNWPWCDNEDRPSAASWLNKALQHMAWREDRLEFTNAVTPPGDHDYLPALLDRYRTQRGHVVALGGIAQERVADLGGNPTGVMHPHLHRVHHYDDGPTGYAALLEKALR